MLGFLAGMLYLAAVAFREKVSFEDMIYIYVWGAVGTILGSKLLYLILEAPDIILALSDENTDIMQYLLALAGGGFVYYGGMTGAFVMTRQTARYFGRDPKETINQMIPALPLAHSIARLGCLAVGCCYGIETDSAWGIIYHHSEIAPNGVRLFPVQPAETAAELGIFLFLLYRKSIKNDQRLASWYLALYAAARFILEFFRGDTARGIYGMLSVSQWISMLILLSVISFRLFEMKKDYKNIV